LGTYEEQPMAALFSLSLLLFFQPKLAYAGLTVHTVYMKTGFVFSQTDNRPMYQQIMEQIKQRIAVGDWPPNTPLPSVRELAVEIKVSIITIKRAYLELGREGVIVTQQGKGSWVNDRLDLQTLQREELIQHLEQAGKLAKSLALPEEKMLQMLKQYME
jgi:GntR family transcriptional regulator